MGEKMENKIPIWPSDFCFDGESIWIFHGRLNAIFRYKYKENILNYVTSVPNENIVEDILFSRMAVYDNKLFLIPIKAKYITIYDIENDKFEFLELELINYHHEFQEMCVCGKYIYCFPCSCQFPIIKIDMENSKIDKYITIKQNKKDKIYNHVYEKDNVLYGVIYPSNEYFVFDCQKDTFVFYTGEKKDCKYSSIICNEKNIYLHDADNPNILKIDKKSKKIIGKIPLDENGYRFRGFLNGELFIDYCNIDKKILINLETNQIQKICVEPNVNVFCDYWYEYGVFHEYNNLSFYFNRSNGYLYIFNEDQMVKVTLTTDRDFLDNLIDRVQIDRITESQEWDLCQYIKYVGHIGDRNIKKE